MLLHRVHFFVTDWEILKQTQTEVKMNLVKEISLLISTWLSLHKQ